MATILKAADRTYQQKLKGKGAFGVLTDISRFHKGLQPENLNFDFQQLAPGHYSSPYHFHRYAEELFLIVSGCATLRTPEGFAVVESGDLLFFEKGEAGAHQLYNHSQEVCTFLDIRVFLGFDVCEYPDSDKIFLVPSAEIYGKDSQLDYFDGEDKIAEKWDSK